MKMGNEDLKSRLYLSGMDERAPQLAAENGLGLEVTAFAHAVKLDEACMVKNVEAQMQGISRFWFHAPFSELCPAAIDPLVREVAFNRFKQTIKTASDLKINHIVFHAGFIPTVYFPEWFVPESIDFWKKFLKEVPDDMTLVLENVMEPGPRMMIEIIEGVNDERFGLCLDIGHANCDISMTRPQDWVDPMIPYIKHVHLHSNFGENDLHLPLGEGNVEAKEIIEKLLAKTNATFTIENQDCQPSLIWLKEQGLI